MIDRKALLDDLKKLVTKLEKDLRERCEENAEVDARVRIEYEKAKEAKRTAQAYKVWRDEWITQVAVAWVLGVVFVRFIEDNGLIAAPFIAGPGERLRFAKEQRTAFFQQNPTQSDREYLEHVFREVAKLPAMKELYDERHNPLWALGVSGDGAKLILEQFQKIDPGTGTLVHDFTDPEWGTRFLGDLYQDLSETARKKYALVQTPDFVEEFILDRTLTPAVAEFGLAQVKVIDPTCGSGHFLIGAFARLSAFWQRLNASATPSVLAQRALDAIFGVDINPYAVAIARFRLLVESLKFSGISRLQDAPTFDIHLAVGDSLLHGAPGVGGGLQAGWYFSPTAHLYEAEDRDALTSILVSGRYHVVVGNPPYVRSKDQATNDAYRGKFQTCHGKFSPVVPFIERFFDLALKTEGKAGYLGLIVANSFMKRDFGKKLITAFLPSKDLTHVIDTSGAYIPGHGYPKGTPTAILFGRSRPPVSDVVRTVMSIRAEPGIPQDPASARVWSSIVSMLDTTSANEFVSISDVPRAVFAKYPWSIGGGGASELKHWLDTSCSARLASFVEAIGVMSVLGDDEVQIIGDLAQCRRIGADVGLTRPLVVGDQVRDWRVEAELDRVWWLYNRDGQYEPPTTPAATKYFWPYRTTLRSGIYFGKSKEARGLDWTELAVVSKDKLTPAPSIVFPFVATHNHFAVADTDNTAFKQTAPLVKLRTSDSRAAAELLLGVLNSSVACFWARQTFFPKGGFSAGKWEERLEWDSKKLATMPLPAQMTTVWGAALAQCAETLRSCAPMTLVMKGVPEEIEWAAARKTWNETLERMISLQEELDWAIYAAYGLTDEELTLDPGDVPSIRMGQRAFEITLAREADAGGDDQEWFSRHGCVPVVELPPEWPKEYRRLVQRRLDVTADSEKLRLVEQPEFKRRWAADSWDEQAARALRTWLRTRLEEERYWTGAVSSIARLGNQVAGDRDFMRVGEMYRDTHDFDVNDLVRGLVVEQAVPILPADRYKEAGIRKRQEWEATWASQRGADTHATAPWETKPSLGDPEQVPAPPEYDASDFRSKPVWSLRGKLDVPKETFVSLPGCERDSDPSMPILWAGFTHLGKAQAIAAYYQDLKENEAAAPTKLRKLLAAILELLPWLKQWHNEIDPEYGARMGDFFESFMHAEMAALGLTMDDLRRIRGL